MLVGSTTSTAAASSCPAISDQSSKVEQMETLNKTSRVIRNGDSTSAATPPTAIYRENQETPPSVDQKQECISQHEPDNIEYQQQSQEEEVDLLRNCDGIR